MAKSLYYQSKHWKELRAKVLKRDKYYCQHCGAHCLGKKYGKPTPAVDHIVPRRPVTSDLPTNFDIDENLVTLCWPCHTKKTAWVDNNEKKEIGADGFPIGGEWS